MAEIQEEITNEFINIIKEYPEFVKEKIETEFINNLENINSKTIKNIEQFANNKTKELITNKIKIDNNYVFATTVVKNILIKLFINQKINLNFKKLSGLFTNKHKIKFYLNWKGISLIEFKINQENKVIETQSSRSAEKEIKERITKLFFGALKISKESKIKRYLKTNKIYKKLA